MSSTSVFQEFVIDTHALYWYLINSPHLSAKAKSVFSSAAAGNARLFLPSIVMSELYYLNAKLGYQVSIAEEFSKLASAGQFEFVDFRAEDTLQFDDLRAVPEMHDRIIVGVARARVCHVVSVDASITSCKLVEVVW